jgi:metacaspase-1
MPRGVSIHIGVSRPQGCHGAHPLKYAETNAWRMAGLAERAGYGSALVLRGQAATKAAVHDALTGAAAMLGSGDTLLVSFSGHGPQLPDAPPGDPRDPRDERDLRDEGWCLADEVLLDDRLAGYWQLFEPGVRIVVVSESCFAGGVRRDDEDVIFAPPPLRPVYRGGAVYQGEAAYRSGGALAENGAGPDASCIGQPPLQAYGIRASVLLLAAASEAQPAQDGLFTRHLLEVWDEGTFRGSYCDLHRQVRGLVMANNCRQEPQIQMLGTEDPAFPLEPAFHLERRVMRGPVYR